MINVNVGGIYASQPLCKSHYCNKIIYEQITFFALRSNSNRNGEYNKIGTKYTIHIIT